MSAAVGGNEDVGTMGRVTPPPRSGGWGYVLLGLLSGLIAYYVFSYSSAVWANTQEQGAVGVATILSVVVGLLMALLATSRPLAGISAAIIMLLVALVGFIAGSPEYQAVLPSMVDFLALWRHGARSPLVLTVAVALLASGLVARAQQRRGA